MLKSEESSYVTPAQRRASTEKTSHANTWQTGNLFEIETKIIVIQCVCNISNHEPTDKSPAGIYTSI